MDTLLEYAITAMNTAAFVYLAAAFGFVFAVASQKKERSEFFSRGSRRLVYLGFAAHTAAMLTRWYIGGISRPPWTNLYESLVFFAWGVSAFQVYAQRKYKLDITGFLSMPLVFILMGMSVMTPTKDVEPLIPALQSHWLKIHVVFGMLSYAGFTTAGCLAFLHLLKNRVPLARVAAGLAALVALNVGIAGGRAAWTTGGFEMARTTTVQGPDGKELPTKDVYREHEGGKVLTRMETVPGAAPFYWVAFGGMCVALALFVRAGWSRQQGNPKDLPKAGVIAYVTALVATLGLFGTMGLAVKSSPNLTMHSNPYLVTLLAMTFLLAVAFLFIARGYDAFLAKLPSAERLDELSYSNILFAFPFQTLLLITGAVWAYYAWGRSWGWDPKETWALITWFAFLIYLHGRLLMRWSTNLLSVVAIVGFMILVFAFLGVNLVLSGLHAYGSA